MVASVASCYTYDYVVTVPSRDYFQEFMNAMATSSGMVMLLGLACIPLIHILSYIGLLLFLPIARALVVLYLAVSVLLWSFIGTTQIRGLVSAFDQLELVFLGIVVGIMYLPPFASLFEY